MRRWFPALLLVLLAAAPGTAAGLLIPKDGTGGPLDMVDHKVTVAIDEQVAVTRIEQTFRNHTDRALEATYVFPVPKGASVNKFTMWVDGKETKGELVEADKARQVYTDIVQRLKDPGLLEYMGCNLIRLRVFPVPPHGDQKVAVSFTAVNNCDSGMVEYLYPLKTDSKATGVPEKFKLDVTIKSRHAVQNVYSPTHQVSVKHQGDRAARVVCAGEKATLDKDFQLYYTLGKKDVGLTALLHRPDAGADGHFLLLISPRAELARTQQVPRDMVFVLDTSGSMSGPKMEQARRALKFCLDRLSAKDRFAVINFATTVNHYREGLTPVNKQTLADARKWVDELEATGATAIDDALKAALALRSKDQGRTFTVVFFTDGQPTIGETNPQTILKHARERNSANTRIFTFGVGDDVNAALLDRLADDTRAVSTYVRPEEDIEAKVSGLYAKISHPVMTDLQLRAGSGIVLSEMYPTHLPDLFHGGQVVVLGCYKGKGHAALTLRGKVGEQAKEFVYEVEFPAHTGGGKAFVADLWARRKVGYLLDEIRRSGEKKELKDEVVKLAKKHAIATPYTSYLVVPDTQGQGAVASNALRAQPHPPVYLGNGAAPPRPGAAPSAGSRGVVNVPNSGTINYAPGFAYGAAPAPPAAPAPALAAAGMPGAAKMAGESGPPSGVMRPAADDGADQSYRTESAATMQQRLAYEQMRSNLARGDASTGKLGVDLAVQLNELRNQDRLATTNMRQAAGRNCWQVGAAWVDEGFNAGMKKLTVKVLSKAYFRMLAKHPELKEVFKLGNRVVWVAPNGVALLIDPVAGKEELSDAEIDRLFVKK
jgi:Ca-activated chloride channel family protein